MNDLELSNLLRATAAPTTRSLSLRRKVCGFGVNDADYMVMSRQDGKLVACPAYASWHNVLIRVFDPKLHAKHATYSTATVHKPWLSFMEYRKWWTEKQVQGYALDKDLLFFRNKEYSPERCVFVPPALNAFITHIRSDRGEWPVGVSFHKRLKKYQAECSNPESGKKDHLGYFFCPDLAHEAWKKRKLEGAEFLRPMMDNIDLRIYPNVVAIIKNSN